MELSSLVASLVPNLVLSAVVTFARSQFGLAAIPFRRVGHRAISDKVACILGKRGTVLLANSDLLDT
jgi:hypothetical protein